MDKEPESNAWKKRKKMAQDMLEREKMGMHFNEIMNLILENFPNAELAEDNDGQLIIYTGLESDGNDLWIPIT